jgi:hypothetical protein
MVRKIFIGTILILIIVAIFGYVYFSFKPKIGINLPTETPTCGQRGLYTILLPNDSWYGLLGADNILDNMILQNNTAQISVTGWVWSGYNSSSGYASNFLGNIYAESYTVNGTSYTVSPSIVTVTSTIIGQGTQTVTIGQPAPNEQVVTTTYTEYYGLMTLQLPGKVITVNGLLDWGPPVCVIPAQK